jgi:hypothetical protein
MKFLIKRSALPWAHHSEVCGRPQKQEIGCQLIDSLMKFIVCHVPNGLRKGCGKAQEMYECLGLDEDVGIYPGYTWCSSHSLASQCL